MSWKGELIYFALSKDQIQIITVELEQPYNRDVCGENIIKNILHTKRFLHMNLYWKLFPFQPRENKI